MARTGWAAAAAAVLAGCGGGGGGTAHVADPAAAPLYCYRTLADVDCRREPEPGGASRLVGAVTLPPPGR
jgi:hypothetical protein